MEINNQNKKREENNKIAKSMKELEKNLDEVDYICKRKINK
jgi:hypothetical protein